MRQTLLLIALFVPVAAMATPPQTLQHQARLTDSLGAPTNAASIQVTFRLFDVEQNGVFLWEEVHTDVVVTDGYLSVVLGEITPFGASAFSGSARWLETAIGNPGTVLGPRTPLASVPFALVTQEVRGGTVDATSVSVNGQPVATQADPGAGLCARMKNTTATYTGANFGLEADADHGSSACGTGFHACNYAEYSTYSILGGCSLPSSWIVGGFSSPDIHRRSLWNGQDSTQCLPGNLLRTYGEWGPYHGRVHCSTAGNTSPIGCCSD